MHDWLICRFVFEIGWNIAASIEPKKTLKSKKLA